MGVGGPGSLLAEDLRIADAKEAYDACCKLLLAEREVLGWVLNGCLREFSNVSPSDIARDCILGDPQVGTVAVAPGMTGSVRVRSGGEDAVPNEGSVGFDILFRARVPGLEEPLGITVNVEAQRDYHPGYPLVKRGIFYCARMLSSQYGTLFSHADYARLEKVCSIWVCLDPPTSQRNTLTTYAMQGHNRIGTAPIDAACDLLEVSMVRLGGLGARADDLPGGMLGVLGTLFSGTIPRADKLRMLGEDYGIPVTPALQEKVVTMGGWSEDIWERGIERGEQKGRLDSLRSLIANLGLTVEQALAATGVPEDERPRYAELLRDAPLAPAGRT